MIGVVLLLGLTAPPEVFKQRMAEIAEHFADVDCPA
jgi:hypothetical protein